MQRNTAFKFFVRVALVGLAGLFVVVQSPTRALAGNSVAFFVSAPGVEGPVNIAGSIIETFDGFAAGVQTALSIGNVTAGSLSVTTANPWAGAVSTSTTPAPSNFILPVSPPNNNYPSANKTPFAAPNSSVTITLIRPVNYLGLYWAAGSAGNIIRLRSSGTLVAQFTSADLMSLVPTTSTTGQTVTANDGLVYNVDDYRGGHKGIWDSWRPTPRWNDEPFAFIHAVVPSGVTFDTVELVSSSFEFDNITIGNYTGTFNPAGLVGIPLVSSGNQPVLASTVIFRSNDVNATSTTQSVATGLTTPLRANDFARPGYTFTGWYTTASGSGGTPYADEGNYGFGTDLTLHAQWAPTPYTVSYDTHGGAPVADDTFTMESSVTLPAAPVRSGHSFAGWFTTSTAGTALGSTYAPPSPGNVTLHAQWTVDTTTSTTVTVAPASTVAAATTSTSTTLEVTATSTTSTSTTTTPVPTLVTVKSASRATPLPTTGSSQELLIFALALILIGLFSRLRWTHRQS